MSLMGNLAKGARHLVPGYSIKQDWLDENKEWYSANLGTAVSARTSFLGGVFFSSLLFGIQKAGEDVTVPLTVAVVTGAEGIIRIVMKGDQEDICADSIRGVNQFRHKNRGYLPLEIIAGVVEGAYDLVRSGIEYRRTPKDEKDMVYPGGQDY